MTPSISCNVPLIYLLQCPLPSSYNVMLHHVITKNLLQCLIYLLQYHLSSSSCTDPHLPPVISLPLTSFNAPTYFLQSHIYLLQYPSSTTNNFPHLPPAISLIYLLHCPFSTPSNAPSPNTVLPPSPTPYNVKIYIAHAYLLHLPQLLPASYNFPPCTSLYSHLHNQL